MLNNPFSQNHKKNRADSPAILHQPPNKSKRAVQMKLKNPPAFQPTSQPSDIVQRIVLVNTVVANDTYVSQPHEGTVYHMIVDPLLDSALNIHMEKAKAFASAGSNRHERLGLLFQYVDSLNKDEGARDAIYQPTGQKDRDGNNIREALLGTCLNVAAACRELSAFLQLLLAEEGVQTDMKVGNIGGMFDAQRHAWLQIPEDDESVIDPTMTRVGMKPHTYRSGDDANLSMPSRSSPIDIHKMQEIAYNTQERTHIQKLMREPKTLRENANDNAEDYDKRRNQIIGDLRRTIDQNPKLKELEREEVFDFAAIAEKSIDELTTEILPQMSEMARWP